eukprot:COSAG05_NODE_9927_length_593_cov_0.726721_1_plen_74_part_10
MYMQYTTFSTLLLLYADTPCTHTHVCGRGDIICDILYSWHRDKPPADCWPLPNYRVVKAMVYLWDVSADGGPTA